MRLPLPTEYADMLAGQHNLKKTMQMIMLLNQMHAPLPKVKTVRLAMKVSPVAWMNLQMKVLSAPNHRNQQCLVLREIGFGF